MTLATARSFLFVPADRPERLPKALASGAHAVIVDLEDAVAPADKPAARVALLKAVPDAGASRVLVRINPAGSEWHADDLALLRELARYGLGGVVLPKADGTDAIGAAAEASRAGVIPLIESAAGLHRIEVVARAPGVVRLAFGHLDFMVDMGIHCSADEHELDAVRLQVVLISRIAGLAQPLDGVTTRLEDASVLAADIARGRRFGFGGKLCIHPKQVTAVNEGFGPTAAERAWAERVLDAARAHPSGAFRLDGQMVDAPVIERARRIIQA